MTDVHDIAAACARIDGVHPLNDSARLVLGGDRPGQLLREPGGFAVLDDHDQTVLVAVAPEQRRHGIGSRLLRQALQLRPGHSVWAFGTLPAARALAARVGLVPVRELLRMGRDLGVEAAALPAAGYTIRSFAPADAPAVVAVNRAAFAHHPEQGRLSLDDFHALTRQSWFDPAGLLVAHIDEQIVGFHWTKRHDETTGEVYVLAVHPDVEGQGIGRELLNSGLAHLRTVGCRRVELYVEASESRVVRLYRNAGFDVSSTDTNYRQENS
ncbi:MAG: mycothiol synthase [Propionibacteriaceae bacterium]|nr:mycothiol synthase [Propionibacteriaceae bacterium]